MLYKSLKMARFGVGRICVGDKEIFEGWEMRDKFLGTRRSWWRELGLDLWCDVKFALGPSS